MRRILMGFAMAAWVAVVPALALAGNQDVANQLSQKLRNNGQLSGYKIGIKCQAGTVWLSGSVTSEEQMNKALKLAFQTPGVTRVVNELSVASATPAQPAQSDPSPSSTRSGATARSAQATSSSRSNPLRAFVGGSPVLQNTRWRQKDGPAKPVEAAVVRSPEREHPAGADQVSSSSRSEPVEAASAQEEVPQKATMPSRVKPTVTNYVAMQACPRAPGAPNGSPLPMYTSAAHSSVAPARYDQPCLPNYAWPSYAAYPNYAAVTYPKQYSPTAWPYIGPFYPYPQVPLGWRKVTLEWDDGWWFLDFKDQPASCWQR